MRWMLVGNGDLVANKLLTSLRTATRSQHAHLDAAIGPEVSRSRESYARFLDASSLAAVRLESAVERELGTEFPSLRGGLLRADLAELGFSAPALAFTLELRGEAAAFGAAYVLEGSALGGVVLAANVRRALGEVAPTRYLTLRGTGTAARWRWFLEELGAFESRASEEALAETCRSAVAAFDLYSNTFAFQGSGLFRKAL